MDDSYYYTFKMHFEWEDRAKKIITCSCRINNNENYLNGQEALIRINLKDNEIHYLKKGNIDEIKMPEEEFREAITKASNRWIEKQLG